MKFVCTFKSLALALLFVPCILSCNKTSTNKPKAQVEIFPKPIGTHPSWLLGFWRFSFVTSRSYLGTDSVSESSLHFNQGSLIKFDSSGLISPTAFKPGKLYWGVLGDTLHLTPFLIAGDYMFSESIYLIDRDSVHSQGMTLNSLDSTTSYRYGKAYNL